ncbi:hypothetical protein NDU88_001824 [Pleurodeles waltl]|uniref:Secreted protein n=1 Tax=Pleurodeles waltl TaxID=8319 RepID=A0AAV7LYS3_PLEWA|nr:hypothetical protein NDU88_001824 [Pleurodeles waltl]
MDAGRRSIAFLGLFPLIVAGCVWGHLLEHLRVLFHSDNLAVVHLVNRKSARELQVLRLLRVFVLHCLRHDIHFTARHVLGAVITTLADGVKAAVKPATGRR